MSHFSQYCNRVLFCLLDKQWKVHRRDEFWIKKLSIWCWNGSNDIKAEWGVLITDLENCYCCCIGIRNWKIDLIVFGQIEIIPQKTYTTYVQFPSWIIQTKFATHINNDNEYILINNYTLSEKTPWKYQSYNNFLYYSGFVITATNFRGIGSTLHKIGWKEVSENKALDSFSIVLLSCLCSVIPQLPSSSLLFESQFQSKKLTWSPPVNKRPQRIFLVKLNYSHNFHFRTSNYRETFLHFEKLHKINKLGTAKVGAIPGSKSAKFLKL